MSERLLAQIEAKLDELIARQQRLQRENQALREREDNWKLERARLIEKNEIARTRVEAMVKRLKNLGVDSQ